MSKLTPLVIGLLLAGCGSQSDSTPAATKDKAATKAEKAAKDLDEQLVAPPPEVVEALGAEVYPGARMMKAITSTKSNLGAVTNTDYVFIVNDDAKKIRDFYKAKLTGAALGDPELEKMGSFVVSGTNAKGEQVNVAAQGATPARSMVHYVITKKN